ncbi:TrbI/VirB10 family protein [Salmonella enterica]|nr:TrbI/VirB10 family protein [Salmonella enterica]
MTENNESDDLFKNLPRGDFNLLGVKKDKKPKTKIILVIGGGVLFLFIAISSIFFFAYRAMQANNPNPVDETNVKADAALNSKPISDDELQKRRAEILRRKKEEEAKTPPQPVQTTPAIVTATGKQEPPPPSAAYLRKLSGGITVQETGGGQSASSSGDSSEQQSANTAVVAPEAAAALNQDSDSVGLGTPVDNSRGNLSNLRGTSYASTSAYMSPDRKFLLKRKSNLRCALYTGVKTDHPGFVKCILTQPLYSADGSVILAEAGAELDGEQKVEIKPGQSSVFTTWTDLETSVGVRASLNALGTGAMGESGTNAYVDNHYGQRFGGAVMLSFIQDAFASAANATKNNNSTYSFDNSESNAESMATKALDSSINIPPTGYVLPGTVINVIVAQDVDFSSVFKTRPQR